MIIYASDAPHRVYELTTGTAVQHRKAWLCPTNFCCPMNIPENTRIYQSELAAYWFDNDGVLCAFIKPISPTLEKVQANYALIREISNDTKVLLLSNSSNSRLLDDATADYVRQEMPKLFLAMAVISETAMGKANVTIFKNLHQETVPIGIFSSHGQVKLWLMSFRSASAQESKASDIAD